MNANRSSFLVCCIALSFCAAASAAHTSPPASVALVGSMQSELGCSSDWQPECTATELAPVGDFWAAAFLVPAGEWEYKIALNDSWAENYGLDGERNGPNISLSLAEATEVVFVYDPETHAISDDAPLVQPGSVTVVGNLQAELGCPGDWQPECGSTQLNFDAEDGVWRGAFLIPSGIWEYKVALNDGWDENYGANATRSGSNIPLNLEEESYVRIYYDHATHWVADSHNEVIATLAGSFQSEIGCSSDWDPTCLRSWLQDPDNDGSYTFSTAALPAGDYEVKVTHDESWNENYGAGGAASGANIPFTVASSGDLVVFSYDPVTHLLTIGGSVPAGNIREAKAYWLSHDTFAWAAPEGSVVSLYYSNEADLSVTADGLQGGESIELIADGVVGGAIAEKFRHLAGLPAYRLPADKLSLAPQILTGQFALAAVNGDGEAVDATGVQPPGVLDDLFTYQGDLGVSFDGGAPSVRLWAPTARSLRLHLFDGPQAGAASQAVDMIRETGTGVWSVEGLPSWNRKYYLFEVEVYARSTGNIERNFVTDPYSLSLSMNSQRSQIVNLDDADLKPPAWDKIRKPKLEAAVDSVIYELHVRDFSISDESVPEDLKGTFRAFALPETHGMRHLRRLARAGATHVHLLPAFDIATVNEDRSQHQTTGDLSIYPPDSDQQQAATEAIRSTDGFNWGYDPFHYTTPEGSYATDANGVSRILEFREMVAGLDRAGLRVVMDVVYNHTSGSLQGATSVLDKIVPDYYHRLDATGAIETSTCCSNTATEHNMMEKLMLDSLHTWATAYKIDGFRFDLMGHHSKANIVKVSDMLRSLKLQTDGVDGESVYVYGEGWNFGEVANNARFEQATQVNMGANTGVGTFNDRLRDAIRGGRPFDTGIEHVWKQGFINGLFYDPNELNSGSDSEREELLALTDLIRVSLAGNLSAYSFIDRFGQTVVGSQLGGYASQPQESVNYAAAHDNETLFDNNQYKLPLTTSPADRARVQNLGNSIVAFSQGVPFFHAGQEMLRSKSTDRNSYDSGDWFNALDFEYKANGWGRGLPPASENISNWPVTGPLLANPDLAVGAAEIESAVRHMWELLRIRRGSNLFRLQTAQEVIDRVAFHNTGPSQIPGLIVMSLRSDSDVGVVVIFNVGVGAQSSHLPLTSAARFSLHPVLAESFDPIVRTSSYDPTTQTFTVPARTTAVFVAD